MANKRYWLEPSNGTIHLDCAHGEAETFCGRYTLADSGIDMEELIAVNHGPVTCPDCVRMIVYARGVRVNMLDGLGA